MQIKQMYIKNRYKTGFKTIDTVMTIYLWIVSLSLNTIGVMKFIGYKDDKLHTYTHTHTRARARIHI